MAPMPSRQAHSLADDTATYQPGWSAFPCGWFQLGRKVQGKSGARARRGPEAGKRELGGGAGRTAASTASRGPPGGHRHAEAGRARPRWQALLPAAPPARGLRTRHAGWRKTKGRPQRAVSPTWWRVELRGRITGSEGQAGKEVCHLTRRTSPDWQTCRRSSAWQRSSVPQQRGSQTPHAASTNHRSSTPEGLCQPPEEGTLEWAGLGAWGGAWDRRQSPRGWKRLCRPLDSSILRPTTEHEVTHCVAEATCLR